MPIFKLFIQILTNTNLSPKQTLLTYLLYGPFICLKARATSWRQFTFYHLVPRNSWNSFYQPWKDEKLSRPWSHPVVLNTGPLDWESSAICTFLLYHSVHWGINSPLKRDNPRKITWTLKNFPPDTHGFCWNFVRWIYLSRNEPPEVITSNHVWFRNYDHLKYGLFSLDTKLLALWNCFYSTIFNRKHLKFGLAIHFHIIISKTMYLTKKFIRQVCGGVLKLLKLRLWCFSFHFQRAISWQEKIQMC